MQVSRCLWSVNCLCTGVQANTERHTRKETREMCSCWGYKQHSSSRKSEEWRDSNFQQSSRLAKSGKLERTLEIFLMFTRPRKASDSSISCIAERATLILVLKNVDLKLARDDTGDRLSRKHITQTGLLHCPEVSSESDIGRVSVWKNPGLSSKFSNSIESRARPQVLSHRARLKTRDS